MQSQVVSKNRTYLVVQIVEITGDKNMYVPHNLQYIQPLTEINVIARSRC